MGCGPMLMCAALWAGAPDATDLSTPLHGRVTVDYRALPLAAVLQDLGKRCGVRFECRSALLEGLDLVNYQDRDQEAGRVATRILRPRGLNIRQSGDGSVTVYRLDQFDEFKVKREGPFEFAQKPRVTRDGDKVTITFTSKASCDATVAIENTEGQIVRHLASGVLGKNAPAPFKKNSKAQTLVWDGKDDAGKYVDDKDSITVRVSLGLKPRFERTLFWSPKKRSTVHTPLVAASPEGVYVYDGGAVDHLRLFSHDGEYVRTAYPFPAASVGKIEGLRRHAFPHDGKTLPLKGGFHQATLLPGGSNYNIKNYGDGGRAGNNSGYPAWL